MNLIGNRGDEYENDDGKRLKKEKKKKKRGLNCSKKKICNTTILKPLYTYKERNGLRKYEIGCLSNRMNENEWKLLLEERDNKPKKIEREWNK